MIKDNNNFKNYIKYLYKILLNIFTKNYIFLLSKMVRNNFKLNFERNILW